jgi:predicted SnoaL-like aldol condensation-catalyzing enzyme
MRRSVFGALLGAVLVLTACAGGGTMPAEEEAPEGAEAAAPTPRITTAVPVTPFNGDQQQLLESEDPVLAANKQVAYDFFRIVLRAQQLDRAAEFMAPDYIQHNPNADTGREGFLAYFREFGGGSQPVQPTLPNLVAIQAEGDYVTLSFVREYPEPGLEGQTYTTTWFDMFRILDGQIVEHWDPATK